MLWEIREQIVCYAFEISRGFGGPANLRLSAMLFIGDQLFDLLPDLFVIYPFAVLNLS